MAERSCFKQISFDLDTKKVTKYLGNAPIGYIKLEKALNEQGFDRRQGSVFLSKEKLSYKAVEDVLKNCVEKELWLGEACRKIDVTNVALKQFSLVSLVKDTYASELENGKELKTFSERRMEQVLGNAPKGRGKGISNTQIIEKEM